MNTTLEPMKFQIPEFLHILENYKNTSPEVHLSQMFEDEKLNIFQGQFEKENKEEKIEFSSIIKNDKTILLRNFTNNLKNSVTFFEDVITLGKKEGFLVILHNHPNGIALPSYGDIYTTILLRTKNVISTTDGTYNSMIINHNRFGIKNEKTLEERASKYRDEILALEKEMKTNFIKSNPDFEEIDMKSAKFKSGLNEYYHKDENMLPYYDKFNNALPEDIDIKLYNKKTNKYI